MNVKQKDKLRSHRNEHARVNFENVRAAVVKYLNANRVFYLGFHQVFRIKPASQSPRGVFQPTHPNPSGHIDTQ
jgi:hypothetical protein